MKSFVITFSSGHVLSELSTMTHPSWVALQIAEKRREAKCKGAKERYTHLNVEFERLAQGNKKLFLNEQCKELEENDRMGKTRDLFKNISDTK